MVPLLLSSEPHVYRVERLFEKEGIKTFWARQFFRQRETFHVPTRYIPAQNRRCVT